MVFLRGDDGEEEGGGQEHPQVMRVVARVGTHPGEGELMMTRSRMSAT